MTTTAQESTTAGGKWLSTKNTNAYREAVNMCRARKRHKKDSKMQRGIGEHRKLVKGREKVKIHLHPSAKMLLKIS